MKKTTVTREIPIVELTVEEDQRLWLQPDLGVYGIIDWITDHGENLLRFEGENFYREVVIMKEETPTTSPADPSESKNLGCPFD